MTKINKDNNKVRTICTILSRYVYVGYYCMLWINLKIKMILSRQIQSYETFYCKHMIVDCFQYTEKLPPFACYCIVLIQKEDYQHWECYEIFYSVFEQFLSSNIIRIMSFFLGGGEWKSTLKTWFQGRDNEDIYPSSASQQIIFSTMKFWQSS